MEQHHEDRQNGRSSIRQRIAQAAGFRLAAGRPLAASHRDLLRQLFTWALQMAAAAFLSRGILLSQFAPLGVSFTAASAGVYAALKKHRWLPYAAACGAILGYCVAPRSDALRYAAACVLACATGLIFRDADFFQSRFFVPAAAAFAVFCTNAVNVLAGEPSLPRAALFFSEVLLTAGAAYFYAAFLRTLPLWRAAAGERRTLPEGEAGREETAVPVGGRLGRWELRRRTARPGTAEFLEALPADLPTRAGLFVACASFVLVLHSYAPFWGLRLGHILALLALLSAACAGGMPGAAMGLCLGLTIDLSGGTVLTYAPLLGLMGMFCGVFYRRGPFWVALAFVAANAAALPWTPLPHLSALFEGFAASVLFLTFSRWFAAFGSLLFPASAASVGMALPAEEPDEEVQRGYLRLRMDELSTAFRALHVLAQPAAQTEENDNPAAVFNVAIERSCKRCAICDVCWNREYSGTRSALNDATAAVLEKGRASAEDFPPYFAARCIRLHDFLSNLNEALAARSYQKRFRRRMHEDSRLLVAQYDGMTRIFGELMDEVSGMPQLSHALTGRLERLLKEEGADFETAQVQRSAQGRLYAQIIYETRREEDDTALCLTRIASRALGRGMAGGREDEEDGRRCRLLLRERENYRAVVGIAMRQKKGEQQTGDAGTYFKTADGKLYMLISDGMGSGESAAAQSGALARLLECFLRSGISPATTLRLVCPAFSLRCGGESFASVDLFCLDLYTGEAAFYKCGAAPSFIWEPGGAPVRRVASRALPAGVFNPGTQETDRTLLTLRSGNCVVLLSDGVLGGGADTRDNAENKEDTWLIKLLSGHSGSAGELAAAILEEAARREHCRDDATVLVCRLSQG